MSASTEVNPPSGGGGREGPRFGVAWLQRANTTLVLVILLIGMGFGIRTVSRRYAAEVSVPGIYVRVRPERGGLVEARTTPLPERHPGSPTISMEITLADVGSVVRLIGEVSRTRVMLPCPVPRRVSLRVRDAPVENVLEAVAAAANLTLGRREGGYTLSGCPPKAGEGG